MKRRTVQNGAKAGMNIFFRTASPFLSGGNQLQFNNTFGAKRNGQGTIGILLCGRHENAHAPFQRGHHLRMLNDLMKIRRANLFFSFGNKNEVYRWLLSSTFERVECCEQSGFRSLLVDRSATDQNLTELGLVDDLRIK